MTTTATIPTNLTIARLAVQEARQARRGEGHWAALSPAIRRGNARTHLLTAAEYRRRYVATGR